jgi:hypothetical protein
MHHRSRAYVCVREISGETIARCKEVLAGLETAPEDAPVVTEEIVLDWYRLLVT